METNEAILAARAKMRARMEKKKGGAVGAVGGVRRTQKKKHQPQV